MPSKLPQPSQNYQIKITLRDSRPSLWCRIQVRDDVKLAELHKALQAVMGWTDTHLHHFVIGDKYYGVSDEEEGIEFSKTEDESKYKLADFVFRENSQFAYSYDLGDNWEHVLLVEKILALQQDIHSPVCLSGAHTCPPENVGGIVGCADFLKAIEDPQHLEHKEFLQWIGGEFGPEAFDVDEANRKLREMM